MAGTPNSKLKLLYIMDMLLNETDEAHPLSAAQIIERLAEKNITAERKSLYRDIALLREFGIDVICQKQGGSFGYYVGLRDFEPAELRLLVDAVQSSRFITRKKSAQLIKKLEGLAGIHEAKNLQRHVYVVDRIKAVNEKIYYNVDIIHSAINKNRKIVFKYFDYTLSKTKEYRYGGEDYIVTPYALTWADEFYYLVGYYERKGTVANFRVDRMEDVRISDEKGVSAKSATGDDTFNIASYTKGMFSMFGGSEERVKLRFENSLAKVVLDRFGDDIIATPDGENHFIAIVNVNISPTFFGWLFIFGGKVEVLSPSHVANEVRLRAEELVKLYK